MNNTLLIVDDMAINRDVLRTLFTRTYTILEAESGEQAVELIQQHEGELALVLLDIQLPGLSGLDILQMKKDGRILSNVPVLVITVEDSPETQLEAFRLGAIDYITKPFVREIVEYRVANATLRTAYQELNAAAHEKERALKVAQYAGQAKNRFLARMSHELRTPMNAIIGLTHLLRRTPADAAALLDDLDASAQHLLRLLNEMLDISAMESGKVVLHPQRTSINEFMESVTEEIEELAAPKNLQLHFDMAENMQGDFYFDDQCLREILLCLLDNAVKFTPPKGSIHYQALLLDADTPHMRAEFSVQDTGIGISADFLPRIFDEFEIEDMNNTACHTGIGLGLSVCRRTVQLMGGDIFVESKKGEGARFMVRLPMRRAPQEASAPLASIFSFQGKKFLLVEDNIINRMIAQRMLESCHAQVEIATTGQEAVDCFLRTPDAFAGILMDIRMPVMDGLDAARHIREAEKQLGRLPVPIIALTANAYQEDVRKSLDAGMNAHLSKPIEPEKLYATLQQLTS